MSSDNVDNEAGKLSPEALKPVILEAIGVHVREHGPKDWHLVRERTDFAHVIGQASVPSDSRRFWRWVAKVREEMPADRTRPMDLGALPRSKRQADPAADPRDGHPSCGAPSNFKSSDGPVVWGPSGGFATRPMTERQVGQ